MLTKPIAATFRSRAQFSGSKGPWSLALAVGLVAGIAPIAQGQDPFPQPIEPGSVTVGIRDFATLPDSNSSPARASVLTTDPTGRLLVNDQRGPLYTVSDDGVTVTPYLDIRDYAGVNLRDNSGEQGFQSFAFHPDFNTPNAAGFGKFYTISTTSNTNPPPDFNPGGDRVADEVLYEWSVSNPNASTYAAGGGLAPREVARFSEPFSNHNSGLIAFNTTAGSNSSDRGNLYVALGDGGSGNDPQENAQDTSNPYGAILRIDPLGDNAANGEYGIVADNALAADGDSDTLAEIYASGLRNPQRFGWDSQTGNMFIADIGQNVIEEIDLGTNGANYGWDEREGSFRNEGDNQPGFTDPVAEYDHTDPANGPLVTGSRAVTVGEVARDTAIPGLDGKLLLSDFPTGVIFYLDVDGDPLDGGQDGLSELVTLDENGNAVRLIDLIDRARNARGLGDASRADLRFSLGTEGQVFVLNKQDGVIRQLFAIPEPTSLALLGLGGGLLLAQRRRREARAAG